MQALRHRQAHALAVLATLFVAACGDGGAHDADASPGHPDARADVDAAGAFDAPAPDSPAADASLPDAFAPDAPPPDANADATPTAVISIDTGDGSVTVMPGGQICVGSCTVHVDVGAWVELDAAAANGFGFARWDGVPACTTSAACTFQVTADVSITATFTRVSATLAATIDGVGSVYGGNLDCPATCASTIPVPSTNWLFAEPGHGWRFDHWSGACAGTARSCTLEVPAASPPQIDVGAVFAPAHLWSVASTAGSIDNVFAVTTTADGAVVAVGEAWVGAWIDVREASGARRWTREITAGGGVVRLHAVAIATDGTILVAGRFSNTIDPGGGAITSAGAYDLFVAAYAPDGTPRWVVQAGDSASQAALGIAATADGGFVLTGAFKGTLALGGVVLVADDQDGFVARFDAAHHVVAVGQVGGAGDQLVHGVGSGDGVHAAIANLPEPTLLRFDDNAQVIWSHALAADPDREFDASEPATVSVAADGTIATAASRIQSWQATVTRWSRDGETLHERMFANVRAYGIATSGTGDVALTGEAWQGADLGGGTLASSLLIARLAPDLTHRWSLGFGDGGAFQGGTAVWIAADGSLAIGAENGSTLDLGGAPLVAVPGELDGIVARFAP
ncbi:MAG: hypothetical protein K8W52_36305 [Deltaproteobacteria bacterium]|nr:hypothetical protein [Deltaproteobacteria bacterium]